MSFRHKSDEDLVKEIRNGIDVAANQAELDRRLRETLVPFFLYRGLSRYDAEDLTQDVLLKVHRSLHSYRGEGASVRTWARRIAENEFKNWLRARGTQKRDGEEVSIEASDSIWLAAAQTDPLDAAIASERLRHVVEDLKQLSAPLREVAFLRYGQERDLSEIASLLQVPLGTVKSRLARVRELLSPGH